MRCLFVGAEHSCVMMVKARFSESCVATGPGVLIGTGLTALVSYYVFPYGWSWEFALCFGSILAATDPVAVVALLKELGASKNLTMLIAGDTCVLRVTADQFDSMPS